MPRPLLTPKLTNYSADLYSGLMWGQDGPQGTPVPRNLLQRVWPPNEFNWMLMQEYALWMEIVRCGGLANLCPGHRYPEPPWVKQPLQGQRYSKISSIPLPAASGTDVQVLSFQVPVGHDGVIISNVNLWTGTGFVEGGGDLTWRVQINRRYAKDYGAINTTLGSLTTPYAINSGAIRLQSGQIVRYLVNHAATSALVGGRIVCALFGWFYPR